MSLNSIQLMGRLTKEPELRRTQSGKAVTSFTLAVDRDVINSETQKRDVDFIDIVAWNGTAEFAYKWFKKGDMCCVCGRLQLRDWEDKNGNKRRTAEVIASSIYFCGGSKQETQTVKFEDLEDEDDLPF